MCAHACMCVFVCSLLTLLECSVAVAPKITKFVIPNANESGSVTIECASLNAKPVPTYMLIKQKETGKTLRE